MKHFAALFLFFGILHSFGQDTTRLFKFGLLPPTESELKETPYSASFNMPPNFRLPEKIDLSDSMPAAGDQGCQGSCAGWATAYGLKSFQEKAEHHWTYSPATLFSPSFVFNYVKLNRMPRAIECNTGMTFKEAFDVIQDQGAVPLSEMSYDPNNCNGCLSPNPKGDLNLLKKAAVYKWSSWERLLFSNPDEIKYYLSLGMPVVIGVVLDNSFVVDGYKAAREGTRFIWNPDPQAPSIGYHAMVCVGYDQNLQEFKVLNSWSRNWGTDGYMYVPYAKFYKFLREAYIAYDAVSPNLANGNFTASEKAPASAVAGEFSNWFKERRYWDFNGLRFGLVYLSPNKDEIIVQFTDLADNKIIQSILFKLGEEKSFFFDGKKAIFTFNKVDKAGATRRPAAFFTLRVLPEISDPSIKNVLEKFKLDGDNLEKSLINLQQMQQQQLLLRQQIQQQQQL